MQEARNIEDFYENFKVDKTVKIPLVYKQLSGPQVLIMEWIDGIRCTDPQVCNERFCLVYESLVYYTYTFRTALYY